MEETEETPPAHKNYPGSRKTALRGALKVVLFMSMPLSATMLTSLLESKMRRPLHPKFLGKEYRKPFLLRLPAKTRTREEKQWTRSS